MKTSITVISMATAHERRSHFLERAKSSDLNWRFMDAFTDLHSDLIYIPDNAVVAQGKVLQRGEIGCYSSHYAIWKEFLASNFDQCIVLEDDVIVDWNFIKTITAYNLTESGIRYLRFFHKAPCKSTIVRYGFIEPSRSLLSLKGSAQGTQGYIITRSGAAAMMDHCKTVVRPIDVEMDRYWVHGVENLCIFPFPIIEESVPSSIGVNRYDLSRPPPHLRLKRAFVRRVLEPLEGLSRRKADWFNARPRRSQLVAAALVEYPSRSSRLDYLIERTKSLRDCPKCGSKSEFPADKHRLYKCSACAHRYDLIEGTPFEKSRIPIKAWFVATILISSSPQGVRIKDVQREAKVSYRSAWTMCKKIAEYIN